MRRNIFKKQGLVFVFSIVNKKDKSFTQRPKEKSKKKRKLNNLKSLKGNKQQTNCIIQRKEKNLSLNNCL